MTRPWECAPAPPAAEAAATRCSDLSRCRLVLVSFPLRLSVLELLLLLVFRWARWPRWLLSWVVVDLRAAARAVGDWRPIPWERTMEETGEE